MASVASEAATRTMSRGSFFDRYGGAEATTREAAEEAADESRLDGLLGSPVGRAQLAITCVTLKCPELLVFFDLYSACLAAPTPAARVALTRRLLDDCLLAGAPHEVNVDHDTRVAMEALRQSVGEAIEDVDVALLRPAREEVRAMVRLTVWPRFKRDHPIQ